MNPNFPSEQPKAGSNIHVLRPKTPHALFGRANQNENPQPDFKPFYFVPFDAEDDDVADTEKVEKAFKPKNGPTKKSGD